MKRVLTAVVLVPVVLLLVFWAPLWLFILAVAALVVLCLREYLNIMEAAGIKPFRGLTYAIGVSPLLLLLCSMWNRGHFSRSVLFSMNVGLLTPLLVIIFGIPLVFRKDLREGLASVAGSIFGVLYAGFSFSFLVSLRSDFEITLIVFLLFSVWSGDIAAYYVGKNFGKHKLAPVVSPNKSWEGAIASVVASITVAFLIMHFRPQLIHLILRMRGTSEDQWATFERYYAPVRLIHVLCLGIATNVAAQFGDLFESALKRGAGVKDSGTLLPGHGGILDRIDALLFAIPVVWYYATLTRVLEPTITP
jgi:phosphatidate cytidylyltransferase